MEGNNLWNLKSVSGAFALEYFELLNGQPSTQQLNPTQTL